MTKTDHIMNSILGIFTVGALLTVGYTLYAIIFFIQTHEVVIDHWWGWGF